ncbi:MAG: hypothetical protein ACK5QT_04225 [Oligoflexia bacterium]
MRAQNGGQLSKRASDLSHERRIRLLSELLDLEPMNGWTPNQLSAFRQIVHLGAPLYTFLEQQKLLASARNYIEHEQAGKQLVRTGVPMQMFPDSIWLNERLSYLYPKQDELPNDLPPSWITPALRERLLSLRLSVLQELILSIQRENGQGLLERALAATCTALKPIQIANLLVIDRRYLRENLRRRPRIGTRIRSGGLTDLIELVGYFEKELRFGKTAKTAQTLCDWINKSKNGRTTLSFRSLSEVPSSNRRIIASALDEFSLLSFREDNEDFGSEKLRARVVRAFQKFDYWPAHGTKRKNILTIHTAKYPIFEATEEYLSKASQKANLFQKSKTGWTIRFNGYQFPVRDNIGFDYIAFLLRHEGNKFAYSAIYREFPTKTSLSRKGSGSQGLQAISRTVRKSIQDALKTIRSQSELLFSHLDSSLRLRGGACYKPEFAFRWKVTSSSPSASMRR